MKKFALAFIGIATIAVSYSQTVFSYGKNNVSKDEFVRAFNKNPNINGDRKKALREYLDLYTNFKLKVQAAYDEGLDKDATQQYELQNFKRQIADNIINEQANVKQLVKEAFERSQKEIHVAQIFVEVEPNEDSAAAFKTINTAYKALKDGKDFGEAAGSYSSEESIREAKGELGNITAFTLPYEIETLIYNLKPGTYSAPFRSKIGYHIFKNVSEIKSKGSRRVAQILVAMPPSATEEQRNFASHKADSIYQLVQGKEEFSTVVAALSNDLSTSPTKGELPEFTTGTYDAKFEDVAFSLKNPGDISKPFLTKHGYHIIKLLEAKPAPTDMNDGAVYAGLQEKVSKDSRLEKAKNELIEKHLSIIKYKPVVASITKEWLAFTDSALHDKSVAGFKTINDNTVLFSFAKQNVKAADWIKYLKALQQNSEGGIKDYNAAYKTFIHTSADDYYRTNLGDYNDDYTRQVKEFKEANLLFGIMEKNVWGKANSDSVGLQDYYSQHKAKYMWPESANAIIVTCNNEKLVSEIGKKLQSNAKDWRAITSNNGSDVIADSGRYELAQLPVPEHTEIKENMVTTPVKNKQDNSYTLTFVEKVFKEPGQRSFEDARGMVISDYQQVLETKWIESLRKKYPVKTSEQVFETIK